MHADGINQCRRAFSILYGTHEYGHNRGRAVRVRTALAAPPSPLKLQFPELGWRP